MKKQKPALRLRKLYLRTLGWVEQSNVWRCGNHWVNPKYNDTFSLKEAEKIEQMKKDEEISKLSK